jgi:hypothetical protein
MNEEPTPQNKQQALETLVFIIDQQQQIIKDQDDQIRDADATLGQLIGGLMGFRDWLNQIIEIWQTSQKEQEKENEMENR